MDQRRQSPCAGHADASQVALIGDTSGYGTSSAKTADAGVIMPWSAATGLCARIINTRGDMGWVLPRLPVSAPVSFVTGPHLTCDAGAAPPPGEATGCGEPVGRVNSVRDLDQRPRGREVAPYQPQRR